MIIICPSCKRQHKIDETRLSDKVKAAKCIYCGHKFPIPRQQDGPAQVQDIEAKTDKKTRRIAVSLSKGGVGKTTTLSIWPLAWPLAGYKVLLVDTDTQGQAATCWE